MRRFLIGLFLAAFAIIGLSTAQTIGPVTNALGIVYVNSGTGGVTRTLAAWIADRPVSATDVAVCDGSADAAANINAFLAAAPSGTTMQIPSGKNCRAASTVSVPPGTSLNGVDFNAGAYPNPTSSRITCDTSVSPCVQSIGAANGTSGFKNLVITRSGTPGSTAIGLLIQDNKNIVLSNIAVINHGICYKFQAQVYNTSAGIGASVSEMYADKCADAYVVNDSWAELRVHSGRFSATAGLTPNTFVRFQGGTNGTAGGPNTTTFSSFHFGGNSSYPLHGVEWVNLNDSTTSGKDVKEFKFDDVHFEGIGSSVFYSDATWNYIERFWLTNSMVLQSATPVFALNAATSIKVWNVTNNQIFGTTFTLAPTTEITGLNFANNWVQATTSITAGGTFGYGTSINNHFYGGVTWAGNWQKLALCGNDYVSGSLVVTGITGTMSRCDPGYSWDTGGSGLTVPSLRVNNGLYFSGTAPTCTMTGTGTGATCAFSGGSNLNAATVAMTAGTGASASGSVTLTFGGTTFGGTSVPVCIGAYDDTGTAWNAGALPPHVKTISTSAVEVTWNNNAVSLTNGSSYRIMVHCFGK